MPIPSAESARPTASSARFARPGDLQACRAAIRTGSKTFYAASLLLPGRVRDPAYVVYAFCRLADDAVDLADDPAAGLAMLQGRLTGVYDGVPADAPADRALADVVRSFGVPKALFDALLDGFAWDVEGRRYETLDDLYAYAARVAGTVGAIMTLLMGRRDPVTLARACDLGVSMQLSNIARDVGEDAREGRLYLPLAWLRDAGLEPEAFLADPKPGPQLAAVVARLAADADRLAARAATGIADLPLDCRPAINAARHLYREIGREVMRRNGDSITSRAVVPKGRKLSLAAEAVMTSPFLKTGGREPALAQTAFLVDAAAEAEATGRPIRPEGPAGGILEILLELQRRDKQALRTDTAGQTASGS